MPKAWSRRGAAAAAGAALAVLGMLALGAAAGTPQPPGGPAPGAQVAQEGAPPVYQPPMRGAPEARVGGATRGQGDALGRLDVLAPDHVGLTTQEQPTLYWFNSRPVQLRLQLTVTNPESEEPLLEQDLPQPVPAGINGFALADTPVRLETGTEYEWSVAIVPDDAERSDDLVAGGIIQRVEMPAEARDAAGAAAANPAEAARIYAAAGLWYDAIEVLSRAIAESPRNAAAQRDRAALLEQVGLTEAAAHDRSGGGGTEAPGG